MFSERLIVTNLFQQKQHFRGLDIARFSEHYLRENDINSQLIGKGVGYVGHNT